MDVFNYLKKVNSHIKEGAADDAREMGLEYAGYGKWRDPKSGKITHKSQKSGGQTTLVKLQFGQEPTNQKPKKHFLIFRKTHLNHKQLRLNKRYLQLLIKRQRLFLVVLIKQHLYRVINKL